VPSRQASDRFRTTLLKILTNLLPRLQAVDLSHARYEWSGLDHFRWKYPGLEKIPWTDAPRVCLGLSGLTLLKLRLKELYLDNQAFHILNFAMFSEDRYLFQLQSREIRTGVAQECPILPARSQTS